MPRRRCTCSAARTPGLPDTWTPQSDVGDVRGTSQNSDAFDQAPRPLYLYIARQGPHSHFHLSYIALCSSQRPNNPLPVLFPILSNSVIWRKVLKPVRESWRQMEFRLYTRLDEALYVAEILFNE